MRSEITRRARWVTGAVATAASALHSAASVAGLADAHMLDAACCGALSGGVLTALLFVLVQRTTNPAVAAVFALAGAAVAGALNAGLSAFLLGITGYSGMLGALPAYAIIGGMIGLFVGVPFGIVLSVPAALSAWIARAPSDAWASWLGLGLGPWLGLTALLVRWLPYPAVAKLALADVSTSLVAIGLGMAALSAVHLACRAHWLARVRTGRAPGYAIVPASAIASEPDVLPWSPLARCDAILVRELAGSGGAYRGVVSREPIALVTATHHV